VPEVAARCAPLQLWRRTQPHNLTRLGTAMAEADACDVFLNVEDIDEWEREDSRGGQLRVARAAFDLGSWVAEEAGGDRRLNKKDFERLWDDARGGRVKIVGCKEFPYSKGGTLHGDDRLVEREYWLRVSGSQEYVVLHVHFEGRWNAKYLLRPKEVVLQANVRHSVTAAKPQVPVYYDKCKDLDTWREKKGTPVQGLPDRWRWKTDAKAHEALAALLRQGEQCTTFVRSLAAAEATKSRHALIIAVGEYRSQSISDLPNAVNDGMLLKETLEALGWDVEILVNPTRAEARARLQDFIQSSESWRDAVLFAFFGHGIEPFGTQQNFLVMNDTEIPFDVDSSSVFKKMLEDRCLNLFKFMFTLNMAREEAGYPPTISILDCCRNDLEPRLRSLLQPKRGRDTSPTYTPAYRGGEASPEFKNLVFINSTTSGNTAGDGHPGGNGPFMASFHAKILQPGLDINVALQEVRMELEQQGDQMPVCKSLLVTNFYFAGEIQKVTLEAHIVPPASAKADSGQHADDCDNDGAEVKEWIRSLKDIGDKGRAAVWKMLEDEEYCTLAVIRKHIDDIKLLDGFALLKLPTRSALEDAMERLRASDVQSPHSHHPALQSHAAEPGDTRIEHVQSPHSHHPVLQGHVTTVAKDSQETNSPHGGKKVCKEEERVPEQPRPVHPPSEDIDAMIRVAKDLEEKCSFAEALEQHVKILSVQDDEVQAATTLLNIGIVLEKQGKFKESLAKLQESLQIKVKVLGDDHVEIAEIVDQIGVVLKDLGKFEEALQKHKQALGIQEKKLGPDHVDVARTSIHIADVLQAQGMFEKAQEKYQAALEILVCELGHFHKDVATAVDKIGVTLCSQGKFEEALEKHQAVLDIRLEKPGNEHVDFATTYHNMGRVLQKQGQYKKALEFYTKALNIRTDKLGDDHVDVAKTYKNMGIVFWRQGDNKKALEYYQKALEIEIKALGHDHVDVAKT